MTRAPPLPIARAIAHGAGACAIVILVALIWAWMPGDRDEMLALATVGGFGVLTWLCAKLARRSVSRYAANDNDPVAIPMPRFDWRPVTDPEAARAAPLH